MDENEQIPEEQMAELMAEDLYDPNADENYVPNTGIQRRIQRIPEEPVEEEPLQEAPEAQQQPEEPVGEVQPPPAVAAQPPPAVAAQPPPEVAAQPPPEVAAQPPPEVAAQPPPEVAAQEGLANNDANVRDLNDMNNDFDQQMDRLAQQLLHPIDENEIGFPRNLNFLDNQTTPKEQELSKGVDWLPELPPNNAMSGTGAQSLFPLRTPTPENRLPLLHDPPNLRRAFNRWPQHKQQMFMNQMRELIPQYIGKQDADIDMGAKAQPLPIDDIPAIVLQLEAQIMNPMPLMEEEQLEGAVERLEAQNLQQRLLEEQEEYEQRLQQMGSKQQIETNKRIQLNNIMNSGLKNYNESEALLKIRRLMSGKEIVEETERAALPSRGRAQINRLEINELKALFSFFTFQGQFVLSKVCINWKHSMKDLFERHTYLWFSNEELNQKRFFPIEDCCESCHESMDSEPVIRVIEPNLLQLIMDEVLTQTPNLQCLRLYRFAFNRILVVRKLRENCPQLKHLDLTECYDLRPMVIKELSKCYPKLKHLIMNSTDLDEEMLSFLIKKMKVLETLVISSTLISGQSLASLPKCLKRLDIRCCPKLELSSIKKFLSKSWNKLQHLKINSYKSKEVYESIGNNLSSSLILLEVNEPYEQIYCAQNYISYPMLEKLKHLETLKFGTNIVFNSQLFKHVLNNCTNIRSFSMEFNSLAPIAMCEQDLSMIADSWPLLQRLEIINCMFLGLEFLQSLDQSLNLKYLNLTNCLQLNDDLVFHPIQNLPKVNYLVLDKCHKLSRRTLDSVIYRSRRMTDIFRVSMIRCNFKNLPNLKSKLIPKNLRITYSSLIGKRYVTFDGNRTKYGYMAHIWEAFLSGK